MTVGKKASTQNLFIEKLERLIIHGLSMEYDYILLFLNSETGSKMTKPLLRLSSSRRQMGTWNADKREITISRHLIQSHSWFTVRDILRHEMAHQMTDEVLGAKEETAHGATFQKACELLHANPKATENFADLSSKIPQFPLSEQGRLFERVKKLMALSSSENAHEAAAALAKAHELILKHNIPLLKLNAAPSYTTRFVGQPALRHYREDYLLAHLLQEFYFVEGLWVKSYVLMKGKMGRVFEISGTQSNVKIAAYVYDCVCHYIEKQWEHFSSGKKLGRYRRSDFSSGIIVGFHKKLEQERFGYPMQTNEKGLILKGDPHLRRFMKQRYPQTRSIRRSNSAMHADTYAQGISRGKRLSLLKGVEINADGKVRLLTK